MVNPATIVRDVVAALHRWFEKAEREEMEYRREIIKPPVDERLKHDKISRNGAGPVLDLSDGVALPAGGVLGRSARPVGVAQTPVRPLPPPPPAAPPPAATGVAGLRKRQSGETDDMKVVVQNVHNDTVYMQRNEVVAQVARHYERFGPQLSAAVLAKAFLPNGLENLLAKLGLPATGSVEQDHESIADFIDANGVADFCALTGIRNPEESRAGAKMGSPSATARPQLRPNTQPQRVPDTPPTPKLQLKQVNIKPVTLGKEPTPPSIPLPPAAPPVQMAPPTAARITPTPLDRPGSGTDPERKKSTAERNAEADRLLQKELGSDRFFKEQ